MATDPEWCRANPELAARKIDALWESRNEWVNSWLRDCFAKNTAQPPGASDTKESE